MTTKMHLTRNRIIYELCVITCLIGTILLLSMHDRTMTMMALGIVTLESVILSRLSHKRIEYTLTDDESRQPMAAHLDLSNAFPRKHFLLSVGWVLLVMALYYLLRKNHSFEITDVIIVAIVLALVLLSSFEASRNKYIIDDNMLIVREYKFFQPLTEIRIPVAEIDKVELQNLYIPTAATVILTVSGIERKLHCTTHAERLAHELALRKKKD